MGLERAGGVGGDGLGVAGVATLQYDLASVAPATATVIGNALFSKNMPDLRVIAIPAAGAGATIAVQIAVRGDANAAATPDFRTIETFLVGPGPGAPVSFETRFPATFFRVTMTPAAAVNTTVGFIIGCAG